jgi:hypothetical protein
MHPETPFESWLSNNCPDVTATRAEDLPPNAMADLMGFASLNRELSPEEQDVAASLLQRLGLWGH